MSEHDGAVVRLEYDRERDRWTMVVRSDNATTVLPVQVKAMGLAEFLDPSLSPLEIELPPYATLALTVGRPLAASPYMPAWAQGGTISFD